MFEFQLLFLLQWMPENWWDAIKKRFHSKQTQHLQLGDSRKSCFTSGNKLALTGMKQKTFPSSLVEMSRSNRILSLVGWWDTIPQVLLMHTLHSAAADPCIEYAMIYIYIYMICIVFMRIIHTYIFAHGNRTMGKPAPRTRTHISLYHNSDTMYTNLCASDYTEIEITKERKASTSYSKVQVVWKTLIILGAVRRVFLES